MRWSGVEWLSLVLLGIESLGVVWPGVVVLGVESLGVMWSGIVSLGVESFSCGLFLVELKFSLLSGKFNLFVLFIEFILFIKGYSSCSLLVHELFSTCSALVCFLILRLFKFWSTPGCNSKSQTRLPLRGLCDGS